MNYTYYISTPLGLVAGFNSELQVVQCCEYMRDARSFDTSGKALIWALKHSDCGYGLNSGKWTIKNQFGVGEL